MKKLIAGNWKMNGSWAEARILTEKILEGIAADKGVADTCEFVIFPPFVHLGVVKESLTDPDSPLTYGAQDCGLHENGAYTGEVSAEMIRDFACEYVIVGHSERREYHHETNEIVKQKAAIADSNGLKVIICVGEKESEREAGQHKEVVGAQLVESMPENASVENTVIAYEPVWAIGTGKTASVDDVREMHGFIRQQLGERFEEPERVRILYGGSMKPDNARDLLATDNVDGGLIGGASLDAEAFLAIAKSA